MFFAPLRSVLNGCPSDIQHPITYCITLGLTLFSPSLVHPVCRRVCDEIGGISSGSLSYRGFGTLPNKQFCRAKYGSGYSFPMLAMKVLSLVIYYNGKPHLPKESKEKSCNSSLSVCFQYYIDNNVLAVYNVYVVTSHQKKGARGFVKILISNTSDTPLYQQIKDQIKDAILKEELVEGDALPSIRAFANDLKVSVLTIRRVYEELEQEGFIVSQVGIGTFVSTSNLELLRDSKRRLVEQKMADMIQTAKSLKISKEELNSMMDILYEED